MSTVKRRQSELFRARLGMRISSGLSIALTQNAEDEYIRRPQSKCKKSGKRYLAVGMLTPEAKYPFEQSRRGTAIMPRAKFDETVELSFHLG